MTYICLNHFYERKSILKYAIISKLIQFVSKFGRYWNKHLRSAFKKVEIGTEIKTIHMYNNILISIQLHHPFEHS